MGRQTWLRGESSARSLEAVLRLARRATEIDPDYARAWALMAFAQATLRLRHDRKDLDGLPAAERAMALDPQLAEPHAVKARILAEDGRTEEAEAEVQTALALDPESLEVNEAAAYQRYRQRRIQQARRSDSHRRQRIRGCDGRAGHSVIAGAERSS